MKNKPRISNLERARRLRAAGILIDIPEDGPVAASVPLEGVLVRQTGGFIESTVFDLAGAAGFIVSLAITINLPAFAISAFGLEVSWDKTVRFLEDPLKIDGAYKGYRFGGRNALEFGRGEVLNQHADIRCILQRGSSVEGLLLGVGSQSIPDDVSHGATIPAFVTIYDQYTTPYRSSVSLWADRREKLYRAARPKTKRKSLLECPDPGFGDRSTKQHETED